MGYRLGDPIDLSKPPVEVISISKETTTVRVGSAYFTCKDLKILEADAKEVNCGEWTITIHDDQASVAQKLGSADLSHHDALMDLPGEVEYSYFRSFQLSVVFFRHTVCKLQLMGETEWQEVYGNR